MPALQAELRSAQQAQMLDWVCFFFLILIFKLGDYGWWRQVTRSMHAAARGFSHSRVHTSSVWIEAHGFSKVHITSWL